MNLNESLDGSDEICSEYEKDLEDNNEIYREYLGDDIENSSDVKKDNYKSLFELDFNALANAKKFAQQNISDEEDDQESSSTKKNYQIRKNSSRIYQTRKEFTKNSPAPK